MTEKVKNNINNRDFFKKQKRDLIVEINAWKKADS